MEMGSKLITYQAIELLKILQEKNIQLYSAESFTGGLFSYHITSISGSSRSFILGIVTYSNHSKKDLLDIPEIILKKYGSVSEEVSILMAKNIIKNYSNSDNFISVSSTGLAGPEGGSISKPVGTTFFSFNFNGSIETIKKKFNNLNRTEIRKRSVELMTSEALRIIKKI